MYKGKTILGIIPARGGSKGLPRKNIKMLCGKPLIAWTILQAKKSKLLDRCIISTDDIEIARIAKKYGGDVPFLRPAALAGDKTAMIAVIKHVVKVLALRGEKYDYLVLLEPTSPIRKSGDIDNVCKALIDRRAVADSLISVGKIAVEHPAITKRVDKKGFVSPYIKTGLKITRRQQLKPAYFPYCAAYISKTEALLKAGGFYQKRTIPFFIERWQNYEIDDIWDFAAVEAVMKKTGGLRK
ncbi:MAG: acylneuraminate cytidylyltransferase family protein [Elusimicrobia bacterium]|nr:acylneuraminate cytidylyltransferase family protein [Elusimicrobiota bacterium]